MKIRNIWQFFKNNNKQHHFIIQMFVKARPVQFYPYYNRVASPSVGYRYTVRNPRQPAFVGQRFINDNWTRKTFNAGRHEQHMMYNHYS